MALLLLCACTSAPPAPMTPRQAATCHCPVLEPARCPEPVLIDPGPSATTRSKSTDATTCAVSGKLLLGAVEQVVIEPGDLRLPARIDSGAATSSLHARGITRFERDGRPWLRFETVTGGVAQTVRLELPLLRFAAIKGEGESVEVRPVVTMTVRLGPRTRRVRMTLADRGNYEYPVLIGRDFLGGDTLIDTGRAMLQGH